MNRALQEIGQVRHGVVIHGCGLDEISPLGPSQVGLGVPKRLSV